MACVILCPEAAAAAGTVVVGAFVINEVRVDVRKMDEQDAVEVIRLTEERSERFEDWEERQVRERGRLRREGKKKKANGDPKSLRAKRRTT